jgi:hypothetical protein
VRTGSGVFEAVIFAAEESIVCLIRGADIRIGLEFETPKCWHAVLLHVVIVVQDVWIDGGNLLAKFPWFNAGVDDVHAGEGPRDQLFERLFVLEELHSSKNTTFGMYWVD